MFEKFLVYVFFQFLGAIFSPKPRVSQQDARAATEDQLRQPDSSAGNNIAVLFGSRNMESGQILYSGDFKSTPIRKKVSSGGKGGK